jgi:hypothetical protein
MKSFCGLLFALGILACAIAWGPGCATSHADWEQKCGPQVDPLLKPCPCMDPRTLSCPKPPSDAKQRKRTCYRMTTGCTADATGKCVAAPQDSPREIPCDDLLKPDGGTD